MKITIIGAGSVGATTAYTIASMNLASEIIMIDINQEKAIGEALDIRQGLPFFAPCSIYAGDYSDAKQGPSSTNIKKHQKFWCFSFIYPNKHQVV